MKEIKNYEEQEELISEINVTPLVDVMLLLMVIFLVTAPLLINDIGVKLPKTIGTSQSKTTSKVVAIKENGEINFDGIKISAQDLENHLKSIADKDLIIKIAADKNCRYQDVAAILAILNKSNVNNISFLTQN